MRQFKFVGSILVTTVLAAISCGRQGDTGSQMHDMASHSLASVVEFHIAAGTGSHAWNTEAQQVTIHVGDTLRIINDDQIAHRLHTNGRPCSHGPTMAPGAAFDCVASQTYNPATDGELYEHNVGPAARFWVKASAAE